MMRRTNDTVGFVQCNEKRVYTICVDEEDQKKKSGRGGKTAKTVGPLQLSFMMREYLECFMYVESHRIVPSPT